MKTRTYTAYILYYILRYIISYLSYLHLIPFELDGDKRSYCTFNAQFFQYFIIFYSNNRSFVNQKLVL